MSFLIDAHGHVSAPAELYAYNYMTIAGRGDFGQGKVEFPDAAVARACAKHLEYMDKLQVDLQLISPRPFALPSGERDPRMIAWIAIAQNNYVARQVAEHPTRFRGIGIVPVAPGQPIELVLEEVQRCMIELGFIGMIVNPDPGHGDGATPLMGSEYWYPLYQLLEQLDAPTMIHTGSNRNGRETQSEHFITEESIAVLSILKSSVFRDFPGIKLIAAHGGGSVPYQAGRFSASPEYRNSLKDDQETFFDGLRRFYFDTCLYSQEALELLFKVVGSDRCLFGTDTPGTGSVSCATGRSLDDLKPVIESIDFLSEDDRASIFQNNARRVYTRL